MSLCIVGIYYEVRDCVLEVLCKLIVVLLAIFQESSVMPEDGSDTSQFTGSTINLQDLE